jgi:hypothetical protein
MNKCAAKYGFTEPQGAQLDQCQCGCCREQCNKVKGCDATYAVSESSTSKSEPHELMTEKPVAMGLAACALLVVGAALGTMLAAPRFA